MFVYGGKSQIANLIQKRILLMKPCNQEQNGSHITRVENIANGMVIMIAWLIGRMRELA